MTPEDRYHFEPLVGAVESAIDRGESVGQYHHSEVLRLLRAALASTPEPAPVAEGLDAIEAQAGRLLVEAARIRSTRLGPDDAHELRHLWAAINAGNSDPCGVNGESCHLDVDAIRRWTEQYPLVTGYAAASPSPETEHQEGRLTMRDGSVR